MGDQMNLRAGPLEMRYGDGDLRAISVGGREIVRRIYAAVRDRNWGTAPNEIGNVVVAAGPEAFDVSFACENRLNDVDFEWRGAISGAADGTIRYSMDGRARAPFLKNRIGFCVLHPAACAGAQCEIEHVDGRRERAVLPRKIIAAQPVAPFENMRIFRQRIAGGAWLEIAFEGGLFGGDDAFEPELGGGRQLQVGAQAFHPFRPGAAQQPGELVLGEGVRHRRHRAEERRRIGAERHRQGKGLARRL